MTGSTRDSSDAGDTALGLYNYHARFYSTTLGAFVSADTVGDGLNRYAYVHDNPLRYTDPTGHCAYGLSCSWQDAQNWIRCALSCGDNVFGLLARAALASTGFWQRFSVAYDEGGRDNVALFEVIGKNATKGSLHTIFTNYLGGNYLASIFGAGYRARYFEASLGDVLFDTHNVERLGIYELAGASSWSEGIFWAIRLRTESHQNGLNMGIVRRLSSVPAALARQTLAVAQQNASSDLDSYQWTSEQRGWLRDNGFPQVTIPHAESYWQETADDVAFCMADPTCLAAWAWTTDWEKEFGA